MTAAAGGASGSSVKTGLMSDRIRETTRFEQQRDRLAALGKLSAGLAHELNNPASAAKRASSQLRDLLKRVRDASHELGKFDLTPKQRAEIERLEASLTQTGASPLDPLAASDLEDQLDSLLRSHGQNDMWQLAADLARRNFRPEALEQLFLNLDADTARAALVRISTSLEISGLLDEIESSASRISELVRAIKEYTFMDQAPLQNVDVVKTLENTLTILNHKLKHGVTVRRDYRDTSLSVNSFGRESCTCAPIATTTVWWSRSPTTVREFHPKLCRISMNRSSPPRESGRELDSDWTP